eukprot:3117923-Rhodomonas_salina.2
MSGTNVAHMVLPGRRCGREPQRVRDPHDAGTVLDVLTRQLRDVRVLRYGMVLRVCYGMCGTESGVLVPGCADLGAHRG